MRKPVEAVTAAVSLDTAHDWQPSPRPRVIVSPASGDARSMPPTPRATESTLSSTSLRLVASQTVVSPPSSQTMLSGGGTRSA